LPSLTEQIDKFGTEVKDRFNALRIKGVYKTTLPKYIQIPDGTDIVLINPSADMNDYYNQPRVVMLASDWIALIDNQKKTIKRRFTKQGTERE
jgi:hypothetical protein